MLPCHGGNTMPKIFTRNMADWASMRDLLHLTTHATGQCKDKISAFILFFGALLLFTVCIFLLPLFILKNNITKRRNTHN